MKIITSVQRNLAVRERVDPQHLRMAQISAINISNPIMKLKP
jgi:hypothetical protein